MAQNFASGNWRVTKGKERELVERWNEFLRWTRKTQPALVAASLIQDEQDETHFVSFAEWKNPAERDTWKRTAEFMERFRACRDLCDDFHGSDYQRVVTI
ncbi:MAG: antibiotic biosynthesis monooxygenase [Gemmatimonadetes bacterium]|nr:antibiotic biosynthesis monooxygenase [Gemmatimonadota bacterium]